jgi:hypothetical protein
MAVFQDSEFRKLVKTNSCIQGFFKRFKGRPKWPPPLKLMEGLSGLNDRTAKDSRKFTGLRDYADRVRVRRLSGEIHKGNCGE